MLACRVFGHRPRFFADGATLRWECSRACGERGEKRYETPEQAQRYARAFDREDREDTGKRPLLSLLPLGLARRMGERARGGKGS